MATLYADECGNTGPDLMNREQPFAVTAIVMLTESQEQNLEASLLDVRRKRQEPSAELKFSKLVRSAKGMSLLAEAMRAIKTSEAKIFFSLVEKRFLAATLVTETLLDPFVSSNVDPVFTQRPNRILATNLVCAACSDALLEDFVHAIRKRDQSIVRGLCGRAIPLVRLHPAPEAAWIADAMESALGQAFDWSTFAEDPPRLGRITPHTFTFAALLAAVDARLTAPTKLVADADAQFGVLLDKTLELVRDASLFLDGKSAYGVPGPVRHISARKEADSSLTPGIQAADLIAGLTAAIARAAVEQGTGLVGAKPAWSELHAALVSSRPSSYWVVTESTLAKLSTDFAGLPPSHEEGWWRW